MIRLRVLGRFELTDPEGREFKAVLSQPKTAGLLAFLACSPPLEYVRRASLLPLFWPERDEASARHALSQTLYRLRQALGRELIETRGDEDLRLADGVIASDIAAFDEAIGAARWAEALELYRGELLPGLALAEAEGFERWLEDERARLRRAASTAAWSAAERALASGETASAEHAARRGVELDPVNETAGRRIMEGLIAAGSAARALSLYEELRARLRRDLDLQPAPSTQAIANKLLAGRAGPPDRGGVTLPAEHPVPAAAPDPHSPPNIGRPRRTGLAVIAVAAVIPVAALLARGAVVRDPEVVTVAVLPLIDRGSGPADAYLADGLHSALVGELAQSPQLQVLPRSSVIMLGDPSGLAERDLPAEAIVTAELFQIGDSVRLHVELRRGRPASVLWTGRYQRARRDIPALPVELAAAIARELRARITPRGERRLQEARLLDPAAYDAWLRAAYHASRRRRDDLRACVTNAARATALAPGFAEAHLVAAHCNNVLAFVDTVAPDSAFGRAKEAARRAIALDAGLPGAYAELAYAVAHHDWDWERAEDLYRFALRVDNRQDAIHGDFAWLLSWLGRFDEALALAREAEILAPGSPQAMLRTGMILHLARRHEAAARKAAQAIAVDSTFMFAWDRLHWAYHGLDRRDDAVRAAERASELGGPADVRRRGFLANAYARAGRTDEARAILDELLALEHRVHVPPNAIAAALVGLGDLDGALGRLERAHAGRDGDMVLIGTFPVWDPLRGSPRFEALVEAMRFGR